MKTRTILIAVIVAALGIAAVPFVFAGPGQHFRGHGGHGAFMHGEGFGFMQRHLGKLKDELDLTDAQVSQIHTIFRETREQNAPYREQMHGTLKNVAQTLIANPNDLAAAQAALDQQDAAHRAMRNNILTGASKALNVLTPEQRTKLATLVNEHVQKMESFRK